MAKEVQVQEKEVESTEINFDEFFKESDEIREDSAWFDFCRESFYMH